jgi:hypothetical protein
MRKRLIKKRIKQWSDTSLYEFLAYGLDERWAYYAKKEVDKRMKKHSIRRS